MTNWKEQISNILLVYDKPGAAVEIKKLVQTEIIEKLIEEIPDVHVEGIVNGLPAGKMNVGSVIRTELKAKWLWKDSK